MSHRFHVETLGDANRVRLPAETARHLRVLGLAEGSEVVLFDGTGLEVVARVSTLSRDAAEVLLLRRDEVTRETDVALTLACAVPKGRRMDVLVRMCAELGVGRIVPLVTQRSVVRPEGSSSHKHERWRKICISASEQSGRNVVTDVAAPVTLDAFLEDADAFDLAVMLSPDADASTLARVLETAAHPRTLLILVGPEGGFTANENACARRFGAAVARLTRSTLRIETACVAAAAVALCS